MLSYLVLSTDSWRSHDGFKERSDGILEPAGGSNYSSQRRVFEDLGQGVLDNAFEGKSFLKFLSFFEVEETEGFVCLLYFTGISFNCFRGDGIFYYAFRLKNILSFSPCSKIIALSYSQEKENKTFVCNEYCSAVVTENRKKMIEKKRFYKPTFLSDVMVECMVFSFHIKIHNRMLVISEELISVWIY